MKLRHLSLVLALLALCAGSAMAQVLQSPDGKDQKSSVAFPGGVQYKTLKHDGLPPTADKAALKKAYKVHKDAEASTGDYPYPVQMYDYLDYCYLPDEISDPYDEDDEVVWNLPQFSYYNFHKPQYGVGCGAFIENGKMHTFVSDFTYAMIGVYSFDMVTYNAETMQVISHKNFGTTSYDQDYLCLAQCQYPLDETKGIGIFYNMETKGEDWVIMDFENETLDRVAVCNKNYGILVTDGTYLYGWCEDNCIYKIDPSTFEATKVGAHGFTQYVDQGGGNMGAYVQSATYDKNTHTCYWGAFNANTGESGFFKVDLETAQIEKVLDTYVAQHLGICTNPQECDDDVPGPVTDLSLSFDGASRSGTATFTMPTLNFKGDKSLTETLSYKLMQGSTTLAEGEGIEPGTSLTVDVTLKKDGNYNFVLQTQNSVGWSPKANKRLYVGYDTPVAPSAATLAIDKDGTVDLHWTAPTEGTHKGYISDLTYDIYRIHGKQMTPVVLSYADTTLTEQLEVGAITSYTYAVMANNQGHQSDFCYSNAAPCGKPYDCPVVVDFTDNDVFNTFTVCDANLDGYTWLWDNDRDYRGYAMYRYNPQSEGDDWLFSPSINLQAGRQYTLSYIATCVTMNLPERLSIALGKANTPEAMTQTIVNRRDLPSTKRPATVTFTVPEDGEYYLGFQACSDENELDLLFSSFRLDVEPLSDAPAAVSDFSCTAGEKGALDATISFTAPTTTVGGSPLDNISKITIERDNNVVKTWENVTPGESLEFYDYVGSEEYHDWVVYVYNGDVCGDYKEQKLYLGLDVPAVPEGGYIIDNKTSLDVCWEPVTIGAHGGYIDTDDVTYEVRNYYHQIQGTTKDTHMVINCNDQDKTLMIDNTDDCESDITYYRLASYNSKGTAHNISDFGTTSDTEYMLKGKISKLPLVENLNGGKTQNAWWSWAGEDQTSYTMGMGAMQTSAGSNYCFGWECFMAGDNFRFRTTKLDFTKVESPKIKFDVASEVPDFTISVNALTPDHQVINIADIDMADAEMGYWGTITADIPQEVANSRYAVIEWHFSGAKDASMIFLDNINIFDETEDGIEEIENGKWKEANSSAYNLAGQRVNANVKGIIIQNGKKHLNR